MSGRCQVAVLTRKHGDRFVAAGFNTLEIEPLPARPTGGTPRELAIFMPRFSSATPGVTRWNAAGQLGSPRVPAREITAGTRPAISSGLTWSRALG